jgi:hypothetical protein
MRPTPTMMLMMKVMTIVVAAVTTRMEEIAFPNTLDIDAQRYHSVMMCLMQRKDRAN